MNKYRIRILQFFFLLGAMVALVAAFWYPWWLVAGLLTYVVLEIFVGNATLHRYYGHRSFEMAGWKRHILTWLAHHIGVGSVLGWVGHHRWHHQHSDTDRDLHSPTRQGVAHILFGVWDASIPRRLIADALADRSLVVWHRYYFVYHFNFLVLSLLADWRVTVFLYCLPNLLCLLSGYVLAIATHRNGRAEDVRWVDLYTFGEGNHAYHHDNPHDYRFGPWDITAWAIDLFLRKAPDAHRP